MEAPQFELIRNLPGNQGVEQEALLQLFKNAGVEAHRIVRGSDDGLRRITVLPGRYDDRPAGYKRALRMRTAESGNGSYVLLTGIDNRYMQTIRGGGIEPATRKLDLDRLTFDSYQLSQVAELLATNTPYGGAVNPNFYLAENRPSIEAKAQLRVVVSSPVQLQDGLEVHGLYFDPIVRVALSDPSPVYSLTNHGNYGWLVRRTQAE